MVGYWVTTTHYEIPIYGGPFGGLWGFLDKTKYISLGPQAFRTNVLTCAPTFRDMRKPSMRLVITKIPIFGGPFWGVRGGFRTKLKTFCSAHGHFGQMFSLVRQLFVFVRQIPIPGGYDPLNPLFLVWIKKTYFTNIFYLCLVIPMPNFRTIRSFFTDLGFFQK